MSSGGLRIRIQDVTAMRDRSFYYKVQVQIKSLELLKLTLLLVSREELKQNGIIRLN